MLVGAAMTAPIRGMPELKPDAVIAVVRRHQDVTEVFRMMKDHLGLTNEFCDAVGGLTSGHTDKILGPSELKNWGPTTFDLFCEMFAIEFHVRIDMAAVKRMEEVWEARAKPRSLPKPPKLSDKMLKRVAPHVAKVTGRNGGIARSAMLTPKQRSEIARIAALARWEAERKRKKQVIEARAIARSVPAATPALSSPSLPGPDSSDATCTRPVSTAC